MIWYDIIADLKTTLAAIPGLADANLYAGRPAALKHYPTILILRDRDLDMSAYTSGLVGGPKGAADLWMKCRYTGENQLPRAITRDFAPVSARRAASLSAAGRINEE